MDSSQTLIEEHNNNINAKPLAKTDSTTKNNNTHPKVLLKTVNPHITCNLCKGYLIDATTLVECLHSFCHSCITKHLRNEQQHLRKEQYCPRCEVQINKAKPNIKPDATLQAIVYKLVPGLYEKELLRKRAFYKLRPVDALLATPEQRGEDTEHLIFGPNENMSLSLEYADIEDIDDGDIELKKPKYLQCPAILTVSHLKKFVLNKFGIDQNRFSVEIMYKVKTIVLPDYYTLMDVAYIYTWKREAPMRFFYKVRTNKTKPEEVPEIPLRRSPSIPDRKSLTSNQFNSPAVVSDKHTTVLSNTQLPNDESINESATVKTESVTAKTESAKTNTESAKANTDSAKTNTESAKANTESAKNKLVLTLTTVSNETKIKNEQIAMPIVTTITKESQNEQNTKTALPIDQVTFKSPISQNDLDKSKFPIPLTPVHSDDKKQNSISSKYSNAKSVTSSNIESSSSKPLVNNKKSPLIDGKSIKQPKQSAKSDNKNSKHSASTSLSSSSSQQQKHKSSKHSKDHSDEKRENIKIKIDLTRQNSMTVIKNSLDDLKMKFKKDRDSSDNKDNVKISNNSSSSSNSNYSRSSSSSINTIADKTDLTSNHKTDKSFANKIKTSKTSDSIDSKKPLIVKSDKKFEIRTIIKLDGKDNMPSSNSKDYTTNSNDSEEVKKSEFLNSFNLTPTKSLSPEKLRQIEEQKMSAKKLSPTSRSLNIETTLSTDTIASEKKTVSEEIQIKQEPLTPPKEPKIDTTDRVSPKRIDDSILPPSNDLANNKRKNKDPIKTSPKRRKVSPTPSPENKLPVPIPTSSSSPLNRPIEETPLKKLEVLKKESPPKTNFNFVDGKETIKIPLLTNSITNFSSQTTPAHQKHNVKEQKSQPKLLPQPKPLTQQMNDVKKSQSIDVKPNSKPTIHNIPRPTQSDTPKPNSFKAKLPKMPTKKLTPILPKPPQPPMVNIPNSLSNSIGTILRTPDTEIKQIKNDGTNKDFKVYGPTMENPTSLPLGSRSPSYIPSYNSKPSSSSTNYLNYALLNSQKRSTDITAVGMRSPVYTPNSPIYTPNSPIYSPNSPQYTPNYNIPKQPQFKYMKPPAYLANLYQSLTASQSTTITTSPTTAITSMPSLTNCIPIPDIVKHSENMLAKQQPNDSLKRATNNAKIDEFMPPEKQTKVQSLLDSCNISFPSSLSITLHEQNDSSVTNPIFKHKNNSPVNNYIEIVKLPDTSVTDDSVLAAAKKSMSPPQSDGSLKSADAGKDKNLSVDKALKSTPKIEKSIEVRKSENDNSKVTNTLTNSLLNDKKIVPDLTPIEKPTIPLTTSPIATATTKTAAQIKSSAANFQQQFLQSIFDNDNPTASSAVTKLDKKNPLKLVRPRGRPKLSSNLSAIQSTTQSSVSSSMPPQAKDIDLSLLKPSIKPKDLTKLLAPPPQPDEKKIKLDSVLDLSSASSSSSSASKQIASKSPKLSPTQTSLNKKSPSPPRTSASLLNMGKPSPSNSNKMPSIVDQNQQQKEFAKLFAEAIARGPSAFMMPPVSGLHSLQNNIDQQITRNIQQAYWERYSGDLLRMQKAGHFQLREAYEKYEQNLKNAQSSTKKTD